MKSVKQVQNFNNQVPPDDSGLLPCPNWIQLEFGCNTFVSADVVNLTVDFIKREELSINRLICKLGSLWMLLALVIISETNVHAAAFNVGCGDSAGLGKRGQIYFLTESIDICYF